MKKHIIWTSEINMEEWQEMLEEEYPDITDLSAKYSIVTETNDCYLWDEKINLNIPCDIIAIADIGRWNGRRQGYKLLNNINEIFETSMDSGTWYVEGRHLQATLSDHDGTTYVTYLEIKSDAPDSFREQLEYGNYPTPSQIRRYCRALGRTVRNIYGW